MNKADLIDQVAFRTGQTKVAVAAAVEATMATIVETVAQSEAVTLSGFGTFEPKKRRARTGRNPRTGDEKFFQWLSLALLIGISLFLK